MKALNRLSLISALCLAVFSLGCGKGMRKGPYLIPTRDATAISVHWQLRQTETCLLEWGDDEGHSMGSVHTVENGKALNQHQHAYTITGLPPASEYTYRVTTKTEEYAGTFRTAPDSAVRNLKFIVYGDTRSHPDIHDRVAQAIVAAFRNDAAFQTFVLGTGDLVSVGDLEATWDIEFFDPKYENIRTMLANVPFVSCMGNHEDSGKLYEKYFPYPLEQGGRYWSFDYGPAHVVVVDQYVDYSNGSEELAWIHDDLDTTQKPWKFILLHQPGWSAGSHPNDKNVQDYIQPLCEAYGVDMVFAGHNHYYARALVNGVYHITTGGGGAPLYAPDPNYTPEVMAASASHHFCKVDIEGDVLHFSAVKPDGTEIDAFTISK